MPQLSPSRRTFLAGTAAAAIGVWVPTTAAAAAKQDARGEAGELRVNPYLQNPSSDGVRVTWFTKAAEPGELVVHGPGLHGGASYTTEPAQEAILDYTDAELNQEIDGLEQGSWLYQGGNYKHAVDITGLQPGKHYAYTVTAGDWRFTAHFTTAPTSDSWRRIRFVALSDSETEPLGRVRHREWAPGPLTDGSLDRPSPDEGGTWDKVFGTTVFRNVRVLRYLLTEDDGYRENLDIIESRRPDFIMMPGDMVAGAGYQPGWDEFFRYNAGEFASVLSYRPLIPAIGNWENYGALNGGYGSPDDRSPVVRARKKYHAYFDSPANGTKRHRDDYYRVDYGPITVLTLDSSNGLPDDDPDNYPEGEKATGQEYRGPGTDTQSNYTRGQYEAAGGTDLADFNPGSTQWDWVEDELADARNKGQIIFAQFHHVPYSNGVHGVPLYHELSEGQGGTPMRQYHPMFERYGVAAVLCGHSELFEHSFVDDDGDGIGVHYYDVGAAGDGLRGERRNGDSLNDPLLSYNQYSRWTADQHEPERWELVNGVQQLVEGGKHYGHLEINVDRARDGARVTLTPVHSFPVMDENYELVRTERRLYDDEVILDIDADGRVRHTS
ncbi:MAG: fibronectin type III domain-containing protein [Streptosporangiales bacterium]